MVALLLANSLSLSDGPYSTERRWHGIYCCLAWSWVGNTTNLGCPEGAATSTTVSRTTECSASCLILVKLIMLQLLWLTTPSRNLCNSFGFACGGFQNIFHFFQRHPRSGPGPVFSYPVGFLLGSYHFRHGYASSL